MACINVPQKAIKQTVVVLLHSDPDDDRGGSNINQDLHPSTWGLSAMKQWSYTNGGSLYYDLT